MNEATIERVAKHLAAANGDPSAWGAYAHQAMIGVDLYPVIDEAMWAPMETAPKIGEGILVNAPNFPEKVLATSWNPYAERGWSLWGCDSISFYFGEEDGEAPTHWRPLPKPPKT